MTHTTSGIRRRRTGVYNAIVVSTLAAVMVGCASGDSILNAGNDGPRPTRPEATTSASTGGGPGTTINLGGGGPATTIDLTGGGGGAPPTTIDLTGGDEAGWSGRGVIAAPPTDYAPCPVDALDTADGPVTITYWHTMTNVLEETLIKLTDEYNASQDKVIVKLANQNGYEQVIDKYFQSSQSDRPEMVMMPEYMVQQMADANTVVPIGACIQTEGYDLSALLPRALLQYQTGGVQWSMPFNMSAPVLYYNKKVFEEAGLDPDKPPVTLEEMREYSQKIVDSGAATYGWAVDTGIDSGGGWFLEQWFARAGLAYSDNGNGREARSTQVLFDAPETVDMLTQVQTMIDDGLAVNVGDNTSGQDVLLKLADAKEPAAMGITTSAGLGTVKTVTDAGMIPGITSEQIGVGPMPGPSDTPSALVGGASLYIVRDKGDEQVSATWDFIKFLLEAETQSTWAAATGYVPVNGGAVDLEPLASTFTDDPRFKVAYDEIVSGGEGVTDLGPALGPMREIRAATAQMMASIYNGGDVAEALTACSDQANLLIIDYDSRN